MGGWGGQPEVRTHLHRHLLRVPSIEIDQKLQEIMKQTGYLTIGGQVPPSLWREREEVHPGGASGGWGGGDRGPGDPPTLPLLPALPGRNQRPGELGRDGQRHLRPGVEDALPEDWPRHCR